MGFARSQFRVLFQDRIVLLEEDQGEAGRSRYLAVATRPVVVHQILPNVEGSIDIYQFEISLLSAWNPLFD